MTTIYSTRFAEAAVVNTTATVYTVPSGFVAVIVDISVLLKGSGTNATVIRSGSVARILYVPGGTPPVYSHWTGRQVLNAGDVLHCQTTDTVGAEFVISGYLLEGP